ncbi:MAG: hypothetical protein M1829_005094 [Trizodia sp. TS-e1964]|nr:MAG: hypothetical protein M1829_005094 [Trizodia sp. TS-e1964]
MATIQPIQPNSETSSDLSNLKISTHALNTDNSKDKTEKDQTFSDWWHDNFDTLILTIGDTQLFLILAFGIAYFVSEKCSISLYHFTVGIRLVILGLATSTCSYALSRGYYKSPLTLAARSVFFLLVSIGLMIAINANSIKSISDFTVGIPDNNHNDSVILMPLLCLLDPTLNPLGNLNNAQKSNLQLAGPTGIKYDLNALSISVIIIGSLLHGPALLDASRSILLKFLNKFTKQGKRHSIIKLVVKFLGFTKLLEIWLWNNKAVEAIGKIIRAVLARLHVNLPHYFFRQRRVLLLKILINVFYLFIFSFSIKPILDLHSWVDKSIWLKLNKGRNPEMYIQGIGQVATLLGLGSIVFTFLDFFSRRIYDWYTPSATPKGQSPGDGQSSQGPLTDSNQNSSGPSYSPDENLQRRHNTPNGIFTSYQSSPQSSRSQVHSGASGTIFSATQSSLDLTTPASGNRQTDKGPVTVTDANHNQQRTENLLQSNPQDNTATSQKAALHKVPNKQTGQDPVIDANDDSQPSESNLENPGVDEIRYALDQITRDQEVADSRSRVREPTPSVQRIIPESSSSRRARNLPESRNFMSKKNA